MTMQDYSFTRRILNRMGFSAALLLLVAGCFQPVNSVRLGTDGAAALSDVSVGRVDGYMGYILKSELDFLLNEGKAGKSGRYLLNVQARETQESPIVDSVTGRVQVANLVVQAVYELKDTKTGKSVTTGRTFATSSFDRSTQRFSAERAKRDAQERMGKELAERLRSIIISALADRTGKEAAPMPALTRSILEEQQLPGTIESGEEN
jgi:LPS-assembly lipoprotein